MGLLQEYGCSKRKMVSVDNGKDIAIHADLSDAGQTVSINDPFIDTVATVNSPA